MCFYMLPVVCGNLDALTLHVNIFCFTLKLHFTNSHSLSWQIHKQAPPLEDIAEDCSLVMRSFLERALERNPALRSSASELLKDEAINPSRDDQPRCWSLDSALEEVTNTMLRQQSQHHDTIQGKERGVEVSLLLAVDDEILSLSNMPSLLCRIFSVLWGLWTHEEEGLLVHWPGSVVRLL